MFTRETVFVLGAGASWHYGYPTGEGLVESVISMTERLSKYCEARLQSGQVVQVIPNYVTERCDASRGMAGAKLGWEKVRSECDDLIHRLKTVRPLVIDYFLAWNETLRPIGKFMIAAAILECEAIWLRERANQNRRLIFDNQPIKPSEGRLVDITKYHDDWYRFVVHKLLYMCRKSADLLDNKVRFITFNYDASLEYHLFRALTSIEFLERDHIVDLLTQDRIVHVYGSVHAEIPTEKEAIELPVAQDLGKYFLVPDNPNFAKEFDPRKILLDRCLTAAQNLRTIDPHDKDENGMALEQARQWITDAGTVYILGYGFDPNNSRRVGLNSCSSPSTYRNKSVLYTNYEDTLTVTKRTGELLSQFGTIECSTRTVYDAIEKDFDALGNE